MKDWRDGLNKSQEKAAEIINGPLLILAGAGSGKTHTMTHRIVHLIETGIPVSEILAVTFTNKAADEMKTRIQDMVGENAAPLVCTFHSLGYRVIKDFYSVIGYKKNLSICDDKDRKDRIKEAIESVLEKVSMNKEIDRTGMTEIKKRTMLLIHNMKMNGIIPPFGTKELNEAFQSSTSKIDKIAILSYIEYQKGLENDNSLDFDDLIALSNMIFEKSSKAEEIYQNKFKYICVDEYQDTSDMEEKLISHIVGAENNICVVGDDYQSIYAFKGARMENILSFPKKFVDCPIVYLNENYRSTSNIVDGALAVVKHNLKQFDKDVFSVRDDGELIQIRGFENYKNESSFVANNIENRIKNGEQHDDIAILVRQNGQTRAFEEALIKKNIPYVIYGGINFYERREVKDVVAYLKLASGSDDTRALERVLNVPKRKIGSKTKKDVLKAIREMDQKKTLFERFMECAKTEKKLSEFAEIYTDITEKSKELEPGDLVEYVIKRTNLEKHIEEIHDPDVKNDLENRLLSLWSVKEKAVEYNGRGIDPEESMALFMEDVALLSDQDRDKEGGRVKIMTIHKSKGMEFKSVYVVCSEDGEKEDEEELEEERRVFYVAMTRAKDNLYISYANERQIYGETMEMTPSRYINEIPKEFVNKKDEGSPVERRLREEEFERWW